MTLLDATPILARRHPRRPLRALGARLAAALERRRTRRALAQLDDAGLADVGLTREEARAESARPFWR